MAEPSSVAWGLGANTHACESRNCDACVFENLGNRQLGVFCEVLLDKNVLFEEAVYAAFDDLGQSSLWLALVASGLFCDAALGCNNLGADLIAVKCGR